jgi:hypothetical protein
MTPSEKCSDCGEPVSRQYQRWYEITGWERNRPGGGTNHVADRRRSGRVICDSCMHRRKSGISRSQEALDV